ncbi:MAG: DUF2141 domain-containing protein [Pseudomonadota bacterium]
MFLLLGGVSPSGQLEVNVEELRSDNGLLHICVTRNAQHFPDCENDPAATRESFRVADTRSVRFANLPSGDYAIAILHDENGNSRLDRFAGIPREGIGFSRNPRFSFGPPRFSSARFTLGNRGDVQMIRMRYFL